MLQILDFNYKNIFSKPKSAAGAIQHYQEQI